MDTYEHITPENGLYSFQITNNTLLKHILPIINTKSDCLSGKEGEMFYVKDIKNCGIADGNPLGLTVINGLLDLTVFGYKNPPRSGICTPTTSSVYVFEEE